MTSKLRIAQYYAEVLDFAVVPVDPKTEKTIGKVSDASTDSKTIKNWFKGKNYKVGIPTGTGNDLLVFDLMDMNKSDQYKEQLGGH